MSMDCVSGTYESVKDDSYVDFLCKMGLPKEDAEAMNGTHWKMSVEQTEEGTWVSMMSCEECPELDFLDSFKEGAEKEMDHPLWGGKAKLLFCRNGSNSFRGRAKTENCGTMEWTEKYSDDGVVICMTHKESGAVYTDKGSRKVKTVGWFECYDSEGMEKYSKATKLPDFVDLSKTMRLHLAEDGDTFVLTECFGKHCIVTRMKLDEECCYGKGTPVEGKLLLTKLGRNHFKFIYCTKRGEEHWDVKYTSKGITYTGCHKQSGAKCKMFYKPITNIFGKFKPVCIHNFTNFGCALDIPADICSKMSNELASLEYIDMGSGYIREKFNSKYMPMDICFKWDEAFENCIDVGGGVIQKYQVVVTREKDTIIEIWKSDKCTLCSTIKFTGDWVIFNNNIVGTDICCKAIYKRCC